MRARGGSKLLRAIRQGQINVLFIFRSSSTTRETFLDLFHSVGKILYNKRLDDELDRALLPEHLKHCSRKALEIQPEVGFIELLTERTFIDYHKRMRQRGFFICIKTI
jgi:hypothetical protein